MKKREQKEQFKFQLLKELGPREPKNVTINGDVKKMHTKEGVILTESQQKYLLPHFTMLLVGKPGSGKTSAIKTLLTNPDFYLHKFDDVLLMSPSVSKMGIKVKKSNTNEHFDLKWIEQKLLAINMKTVQEIATLLKELNIIERFDIEKLNGGLQQQIEQQNGLPMTLHTVKQMPNLFADNERFFTPAIKQAMLQQPKQMMTKQQKLKKMSEQSATTTTTVDLVQFVNRAYDEFWLKLPEEHRSKFKKNCLIIFDDMVSQIKANEFNPLLTQLIFNRRHLLLGGTISVIIVSQKYTMIPARLRSNANWFLLFRLNPVDFDNVYKDVVILPQQQWHGMLEYVFGGVEKKYNSLGIWVETDDYFMNFKPLKLIIGDDNIQQQNNKSGGNNQNKKTITGVTSSSSSSSDADDDDEAKL